MENPSLGAAGAAAGAAAENYAAGLRAVQAIRAAAAQKQQFDAQQRHQQFQEELAIRDKGGVPYQPYIEGTTDPSGLKTRIQNPNAGDKKNVMPDSQGRLWMMPDPGAQQQAKSFSEGLAAQKEGAMPLSPASGLGGGGQVRDPGDNTPRYSADENGNLTSQGYGLNVPASGLAGQMLTPPGGKPLYMPTQDEKNAVGLRKELAAVNQKKNAEGWMPSDSLRPRLEKALGLDPGDLKDQVIPHEALGTVFTAMGKKEKPEAPPKPYQHIGFTDKGEPIDRDPETNEYVVGKRIPGMENKPPKDPNAPKPLTKAQIIRLNSDKARGLAAAERQFNKDVKDTDAQGRKEAEDELTKAKQAVQDAYEQGIEAATGAPQQHLEVSGAGKPKGGAAATGTPATTAAPAPEPAKGGNNVISLKALRDSAKARNIPEAEAIRLAKQHGKQIAP